MLYRQNGKTIKGNQKSFMKSLCICLLRFLFLNFSFSFLGMLCYTTSKRLVTEIQGLHKVLEPGRIRCLQTCDKQPANSWGTQPDFFFFKWEQTSISKEHSLPWTVSTKKMNGSTSSIGECSSSSSLKSSSESSSSSAGWKPLAWIIIKMNDQIIEHKGQKKCSLKKELFFFQK